MTKRALSLLQATALAALPLILGIAAHAPLSAAPPEIADDAGVQLQLGAARILHRTPIRYPEQARVQHVSGVVQVHLTLDDKGEVIDAAVVSGPQELRRPVIQSVLNWHFSQDGSTPDLQIAVHFDAAKAAPIAGRPEGPHEAALDTQRAVIAVDLDSLPEALREKVSQSGILQVGANVSLADRAGLEASSRGIDDHLRLSMSVFMDKARLSVTLPGQPPSANSAKSIRVGGAVQAANLLQKVSPVYPPEAKQARIQGTVIFNATIGPEGLMKNLQVVSGHPLLVTAALEAVKQWVYKPTLLNGNPVEVVTTIDVNFTLNQ